MTPSTLWSGELRAVGVPDQAPDVGSSLAGRADASDHELQSSIGWPVFRGEGTLR
jgi:hypothetical protein